MLPLCTFSAPVLSYLWIPTLDNAVSSIDFHEKLHDRVGVEEQHGDGKSENAMSVKTVLMFASIILHKDIESWISRAPGKGYDCEHNP